MPRLLDKFIKKATELTQERLKRLEGGVWESSNGLINVKDMTDEHLRNAAAYCDMRQRIGHDLSAKMYNAAEANAEMAGIFEKELARRETIVSRGRKVRDFYGFEWRIRVLLA